MTKHFSSLQISVGLHILVVAIFFAIKLSSASFISKTKVDFEVIQVQAAPQAQLQLNPHKNTEPEKKIESVQRKVFGVSRKAIMAEDSSKTTAEIKQGNTVAKENDQLSLEKDDPDSIPIPADDYLVTKQVTLLRDVRIPYPAEAKKNNVEGAVVMDLIIDQDGKVRSVELVAGPGVGLNEAAVQAVRSFLFSPAMVRDQKVAVKIRYTYRFVLESL
ncbi:MAG: TonB family protein [Bdellovibrionota bacterium]